MESSSTATHRPIRFYHRGAIVRVDGVPPTRTVLDWLREDAGCVGTKEGCNEGDCGACTVVVGELEFGPGLARTAAPTLLLRSANACIRFLPTLDGKALFTVEDLKAIAGGRLHPVQQALVECHGSQCGFCTPGFAMSLFDVYENHLGEAPEDQAAAVPGRQALADALSGNLCRCTGYRPILDAGERMFRLPAARLDRRPIVEALARLRDEPGAQGTFRYVGPAARADRAVSAASSAPADGTGRDARFFAPVTLDELATLREQAPDARLLAGCTDIGLWVNKQHRDVGDLVYLGNVAELRCIEEHDGHLAIGAGASLEEAWAALAARFQDLQEMWLRFASPPVRHAGTMGGNIANGSPIGDAAPVLMALDALLELRKADATRRLPLADFYLGYMKNRLEPGEFLQRLLVPLRARHRLRAYKVSKRFDSDITAVCGAFGIAVESGRVVSARLAFGGMAAVVGRAGRAEAALADAPWSQASVDAAKAALALDFQPLTDLRASGAYRMQVAQNLLQRFWLETRDDDPLPQQATSVWARTAS